MSFAKFGSEYFHYPHPRPVIISLANILPIGWLGRLCFAFIKSHAPPPRPRFSTRSPRCVFHFWHEVLIKRDIKGIKCAVILWAVARGTRSAKRPARISFVSTRAPWTRSYDYCDRDSFARRMRKKNLNVGFFNATPATPFVYYTKCQRKR